MLFSTGAITAKAAGSANTSGKVIIEGDLSDVDTYKDKVSALLADDSIYEVIVLDHKSKNGYVNSKATYEQNQPVIPSAVTIYRYRISNVTNCSDYTGSNPIAKVIGEPGTEIGITKTVEISNTYSLSADVVSSETVTLAVGFEVTEKESIEIYGNDTVPDENAGKQVKTMTLSAYPVYATKKFDIERHKSVGGVNYGCQITVPVMHIKPMGFHLKKLLHINS